jgi:hypothetical protein
MDNPFRRQEAGTQQPGGFLAGLQIIDSILPLMRRSVDWLAGLIRLTEEEQEDAGVYLGRPGDE